MLIAGSASTVGAGHLILRLSELGLIDAASSAQVREEAERKIERELPHALPAFRLLADTACRWVADPDDENLAALKGRAHPKDLPILAAAVAAACEWLVTFNTEDYRPAGAIRVVQPGEFVEAVRQLLQELVDRSAG